jgi:hypothetical protein
MNKILYIPYILNEELLSRVLDSFINQVDKIIVINNSLVPLKYSNEKVVDYIPPVIFSFESSLEYAMRQTVKEGREYLLWAHSDLLALDNDVIPSLLLKYEEVKNSKWGMIYGAYDTICLFNPKFFVDENIWPDTSFMFTNYFGDNNRNRLMLLRGYTFHNGDNIHVNHVGSQTIRNSAGMNYKNGLMFPLWQQLYIKMWGGMPGQETINDPTCNGIYPIDK